MKPTVFGPSLSRGVTGQMPSPMGEISGAEQRLLEISVANTLRKAQVIQGMGCTLDT